MTAAEPGFRVLAVCTANVCRSPAVEAQLRAWLDPAGGVSVASAGLHARVGAPVDPRMAALVDLPVAGATARQLSPGMVADADLLLTMTRDHRRAVVTQVPAAVRRTFTLVEFAELVALVGEHAPIADGGTEADRLARLVAAAPRVRGWRTGGPADDVEDPSGGDQAAYAGAVARIRTAVDGVRAAVRPGLG